MLEDYFLLFLLTTATAPQTAAMGSNASAAPVGGLLPSGLAVELVGVEVVVELVGSEVGSPIELFA